MFMMIINFIAYEYYFAVTAEFMEPKERVEENKSENGVRSSRRYREMVQEQSTFERLCKWAIDWFCMELVNCNNYNEVYVW